ncbi:MAG: D-aminoacyl-tRNA deacylase [Verrucomicrobiales bacterium]
MRAVLQRVRQAEVTSDGRVTGSIGPGLVILLGIATDDGPADRDWLIQKILGQKIFEDAEGKMNLDVVAAEGGLLVVSQFTLLASTRKGTKPSWHRAAGPGVACPLYEDFVSHLAVAAGREVATGIFGEEMLVSILNEGPVTLILDSRLKE